MVIPTRPLDEAELKSLLAAHMPVVLPLLPHWDRWLWPAVTAAFDEMIAARNLPVELGEALDDVGQEAQGLSRCLFETRDKLGMPLPAGSGDLPDWEDVEPEVSRTRSAEVETGPAQERATRQGLSAEHDGKAIGQGSQHHSAKWSAVRAKE